MLAAKRARSWAELRAAIAAGRVDFTLLKEWMIGKWRT
jgi:hypothetical protein